MRSWLLKKIQGQRRQAARAGEHRRRLESPVLALLPRRQAHRATVNWTYYTQTADPDGLGVDLPASPTATPCARSLPLPEEQLPGAGLHRSHPRRQAASHRIEWRGGFGDLTVANACGRPSTRSTSTWPTTSWSSRTPRAAKNGPVTATGNFSFAGLADTYFAAVFLPAGQTPCVEVTTFADTVRTPLDRKACRFAGVAVSDGAGNRFRLFVGPKDLRPAEAASIPSWSRWWISAGCRFLAKPLFLLVNWFNDAFVHNFGWSIVLVTIAINMMLFPLRLSNMKSMRKMQALKPQIDAINAKYKNVEHARSEEGRAEPGGDGPLQEDTASTPWAAASPC